MLAIWWQREISSALRLASSALSAVWLAPLASFDHSWSHAREPKEPKIPLNVHSGCAGLRWACRRDAGSVPHVRGPSASLIPASLKRDVAAAAEIRRSDFNGLGKPHAQCRPARDGCSKTHRAAEPLVKDRQTLKMRFLPQGREMDAKQAGRNFAPSDSLLPACGEAVWPRPT